MSKARCYSARGDWRRVIPGVSRERSEIELGKNSSRTSFFKKKKEMEGAALVRRILLSSEWRVKTGGLRKRGRRGASDHTVNFPSKNEKRCRLRGAPDASDRRDLRTTKTSEEYRARSW